MLFSGYQIKGVSELKKKQKNYRLSQITIERIQVLKKYYEREQGLTLTDAQIVEKGIALLMDTPNGRIEKYDVFSQTNSPD